MSLSGPANVALPADRRKSRLAHHWQVMAVDDLLWIESLGLHWPALRRSRWTLWLNILAPGSGLIALQRESAGLPLALCFALSAQTALLGLLVIPKAIGSAITIAAVALSAVIWLTAQVLLLRRLHDLQDLERQIQAAARIEQAREAVLVGQWGPARQLLFEAAEYDIEQPELNWLLAKVYSAVARSDQAARQWRRLRQVDRSAKYESDAASALSKRPTRAR